MSMNVGRVSDNERTEIHLDFPGKKAIPSRAFFDFALGLLQYMNVKAFSGSLSFTVAAVTSHIILAAFLLRAISKPVKTTGSPSIPAEQKIPAGLGVAHCLLTPAILVACLKLITDPIRSLTVFTIATRITDVALSLYYIKEKRTPTNITAMLISNLKHLSILLAFITVAPGFLTAVCALYLGEVVFRRAAKPIHSEKHSLIGSAASAALFIGLIASVTNPITGFALFSLINPIIMGLALGINEYIHSEPGATVAATVL